MSVSSQEAGPIPGLEGVVAADTRLSHVDGEAGELLIGGVAVDLWAPTASFEETVCLLWDGELPGAVRVDEVGRLLAGQRAMPAHTARLIDDAVDLGASPMDVLRMAAASLGVVADREGPKETTIGPAFSRRP